MFEIMPSCLVCDRQDDNMRGRVHEDICAEVLRLSGGRLGAARAVLGTLQAHCPHPVWKRGFEYLPGVGRDHWWWCPDCHELVFTDPMRETA